MQDRAGNASQPATLSLFVDTTPPVISFAAPLENSFTNIPAPSLSLQYWDGTGTGINVSSVKVYLQQGTNPVADITSYFQIGSQQANGAIPGTASLAEAHIYSERGCKRSGRQLRQRARHVSRR